MLGKQAKTRWAQRAASRVRFGGEDRREEHRIGSQSVGEAKLADVVRGGEVQEPIAPGPERARAPVDPVRAPFACRDRAV